MNLPNKLAKIAAKCNIKEDTQSLMLPPAQGFEHWDQLFSAHSYVSSWMTLLLFMGTESSWMMYLYISVDLVSLSLGKIYCRWKTIWQRFYCTCGNVIRVSAFVHAYVKIGRFTCCPLRKMTQMRICLITFKNETSVTSVTSQPQQVISRNTSLAIVCL